MSKTLPRVKGSSSSDWPHWPRFGVPEVNGNGRDSRTGRGMTKGELEELKEALEEYEMTRGDWSKAR